MTSEHSPVGIEPSTKNLILKQALDKEGVSGLASVLLDVACSKKETDDPVSVFLLDIVFIKQYRCLKTFRQVTLYRKPFIVQKH